MLCSLYLSYERRKEREVLMELYNILHLIVLSSIAAAVIIVAIMLRNIGKLLKEVNNSIKAQKQSQKDMESFMGKNIMQEIPFNNKQSSIQVPIVNQTQAKEYHNLEYYNQDKRIAEYNRYEDSNQNSQDLDKANTEKIAREKEVGLVFCRNCGESYLSNEVVCPNCKTSR